MWVVFMGKDRSVICYSHSLFIFFLPGVAKKKREVLSNGNGEGSALLPEIHFRVCECLNASSGVIIPFA